MKVIQNLLALTLAICIFVACQSPKGQEKNTKTFDDILAELNAFQTKNSPQDSLFSGHHLRGNFSPQTVAHFAKTEEKYKSILADLNALRPQTTNQKLNVEILRYKLKNLVDHFHFERYYIPLNAEGGFYNEINFALPNLPFNTEEDYAHYIGWLPKYATYLEENILLLQGGINNQLVLPKVLAQNTLQLLQPWLPAAGKKHPFWQPFLHMPAHFSEDTKTELTQRMAAVMDNRVLIAYADLYDFIETEYLPACTNEVGVSAQKNGVDFYENRVAHFTTLPISADSVFNLGMAEVARIKKEMMRVKDDANFAGSLTEYIAFLRTDKQFYATSAEELLHYAAWLSKTAEGKLPDYFEKLYRNPFTVKPVPAAIAPTYTAGRYSGGSLAMHTAGEYWVNTFDLTARPLYALPALTLHEAVPGHHLHNALTQELDSLPAFRQHFYISAFGEGWGLYSEFLGEEMGMYTTPAEWFGRYTYEMWRACRLVVDVGIHKKGWTRQQAVDFLASNTALSMREVNTEIDRYIGWPGQALSYKMGELKIKYLRKKCETELGERFDLRAFHNKLLSHGSVPLLSLEQLINDWITQQNMKKQLAS